MWEKIKKIFSIAWAVAVILVCTFALVFLRRRDSDGHGSSGTDERDSAVEEGFERCEESIKDSRDTVERCEEHLHRAEDILRKAIERSHRGE